MFKATPYYFLSSAEDIDNRATICCKTYADNKIDDDKNGRISRHLYASKIVEADADDPNYVILIYDRVRLVKSECWSEKDSTVMQRYAVVLHRKEWAHLQRSVGCNIERHCDIDIYEQGLEDRIAREFNDGFRVRTCLRDVQEALAEINHNNRCRWHGIPYRASEWTLGDLK